MPGKREFISISLNNNSHRPVASFMTAYGESGSGIMASRLGSISEAHARKILD